MSHLSHQNIRAYPLRFHPVYQHYLWGGDWIPRRYSRSVPPGIYAESWEVSDRPEGLSVIANGRWAGRTLADVIAEQGTALLGTRAPADRFPLLIKLIDARERLSVQVHPDETVARRVGGEPKSEAWYVLDVEPNAGVYAGFRPGVDEGALRVALASGQVEELLTRLPIQRGDVINIPGGRVHAIGAGCLLLEVQQNSNTTYRLFDWGRVDQNGHARTLHVEQAVTAINWQDRGNPRTPPGAGTPSAFGSVRELLTTPYFQIDRLSVTSIGQHAPDAGTFRWFFVETGALRVEVDGMAETVVPGESVFVPAVSTRILLAPAGADAAVLSVSLPTPP